MTDEEFVRTSWDGIENLPLQKYHGASYWAEAAEFTRERLEQIRQLVFELALLCSADYSDQYGNVSAEANAAHERTIVRLESALADLKQGMKGQP